MSDNAFSRLDYFCPQPHQAVSVPRGTVPPVSERRAPAEEDGFGFRLRLVKKPKEGVILHTDLPEVLTFISTAQQEFQCVLVRSLETNTKVQATNSRITFRKQCRQQAIPKSEIRKTFFLKIVYIDFWFHLHLREEKHSVCVCAPIPTVKSPEKCSRSQPHSCWHSEAPLPFPTSQHSRLSLLSRSPMGRGDGVAVFQARKHLHEEATTFSQDYSLE